VVDASGASVGAVALFNRGVYSFLMIWSLYMATSGQATPSAFGHYRAAGTVTAYCRISTAYEEHGWFSKEEIELL
jgi:hypothetical protein